MILNGMKSELYGDTFVAENDPGNSVTLTLESSMAVLSYATTSSISSAG